MTYPPDDHILRDLGFVSWVDGDGTAFAELDVADAVLDSSGAVSLGALATVADVAAAMASKVVAYPRWVATANLWLSTASPVRNGSVLVAARLVSDELDLLTVDFDLHGAGTGEAAFVRLPPSASAAEQSEIAPGGRTSMPRLGPPPASVLERLCLVLEPDGASLECNDYVVNPFGSINGGAIAYLVAGAAEAVSGLVASDLVLRYLGQVKVGPARATATVVRRSDAHAVCQVLVVDAGASKMPLATAMVTAVAR